jgi:hypothetical protein
MLIIVREDDRPDTPQKIDALISAVIPDRADAELYETVTQHQLHGPCGVNNPAAKCMKDGHCSKKYPKEYQNETTFSDRKAYPDYRRPDDGRKYWKNGIEYDNRDVVPYNPHLSRRYDCHINLEIVSTIAVVKYFYKYVYKGVDRATVEMRGEDNEIKRYIDARYVSSPEALWRIFGYDMHEEKPTVVRLAIHLPGEQQVYYNADLNAERLEDRAKTTLTEWFVANAQFPAGRALLYSDYCEQFTWVRDKKLWKERQRCVGEVIGRMYMVQPSAGELYYLRLLLLHVPGVTSFAELRTVNGQQFATFKEAAAALGLLEDDQEWVWFLLMLCLFYFIFIFLFLFIFYLFSFYFVVILLLC